MITSTVLLIIGIVLCWLGIYWAVHLYKIPEDSQNGCVMVIIIVFVLSFTALTTGTNKLDTYLEQPKIEQKK